MFDLIAKQPALSKPPEWVENGGTKVTALYWAIMERISQIDSLMSSGKITSVSKCRICKSALCRDLGYSSSYINKNKHLNELVELQQRRINGKYAALEHSRAERRRAKDKISQKPRDALIKMITELRLAIAMRKDDLYVSQLHHIIDSGLSDQQMIVSRRLKNLNELVSSLRTKNAHLEAGNQRLTRELETQIQINSALRAKFDKM